MYFKHSAASFVTYKDESCVSACSGGMATHLSRLSSFAFRFRKLTFFKASSLIASVMARGTHSHFELMARARAERSRVRRLSFTGTQVLSDLNTLWAVDQFSRLNTLI